MSFKAIIGAAVLALTGGHPGYNNNIPNPFGVTGVKAMGHVNVSGTGPRNAFGLDFFAANLTWTKALCCKDSDKDGFTNGFELGDECCAWVKGGVPVVTTDIGHPGNATLMPKTRKPNPAGCTGGNPCA